MGTNRRLRLYATNHSTLQATDSMQLAQVTISDSSRPRTSSNNLLAYRPRYNDLQRSDLAGVFINLEGVFPCLAPLTNYNPICRVFTEEEDGFRDGKALIDCGDIGNNLRVFSSSSNILTYGIAEVISVYTLYSRVLCMAIHDVWFLQFPACGLHYNIVELLYCEWMACVIYNPTPES